MIKKNDMYLLIAIAIIAAVFSTVLANLLFKVDPSKTRVEIVKPIDDKFPLPPDTYFNKDSLNPTQTIQIGESNPDPFKGN